MPARVPDSAHLSLSQRSAARSRLVLLGALMLTGLWGGLMIWLRVAGGHRMGEFVPVSASSTTGRRPRVGLVAVPAVALLGLTGCGSSEAASNAAAAAAENPLLSHVHGVGFASEDGDLLVATHDGLFVVDDGGDAERLGPVIDLMGFVVDGSERLLASGHPGPGVDLPQPVGLIESTDGGRTWVPVSRQGESDFHSLAVGDAGVLGFDGRLRRSSDGVTWEALQIPAPPAALAASPAGSEVLATTEQGLLRSTDAGSTWARVDGAPLLHVVAWGDD